MRVRRILLRTLVGLAALALAIQLVPYGRRHSNPPTMNEPVWDSPTTRELARRACFDCHSNETRWGWTSRVAPASWLVQRDVALGRQDLNFSEWQRPQEAAAEAAASVREGEMPPRAYLLLHPSARLSPRERARLIDGLAATLGSEEEEEERRAALGAPATSPAATVVQGRCGGQVALTQGGDVGGRGAHRPR